VLHPLEFAALLSAARASGPNDHALVCLLGMLGLRVASVRASAAAWTAWSVSGSRASRLNSALLVSVVIRVRLHCCQFQRRQVTPMSSRQTTSPVSGCSTIGWPAAGLSNGSLPSALTSRGGPM